ncbi:MAG: Uma2 family endonuclease [Planctomycetes bacterium]|nr:Uma2 family endonuclease [Planctomycetota bacterium]
MSTIPIPTIDVIQIAPLHRFSTADYLEMIEKGVLGRDDHVELIGGMIVEMSPAGIPHNSFLMSILRVFAPLLETCDIAVQGTLTIAEGQVFDPDFMLLRKRPGHYKTKLPDASDVLLVIEAAESSLRRDQQIKLPIYARAGIPEYWIADLEREMLIIHREPEAGRYKLVETRQGDDLVSPLAAPELSFAVRQAFE